jgi:hypothetical protein
MKKLLFVVLIGTAFTACNTKKTDTTTTTLDSLQTDSVIQADKPAPSTLAFSQMAGYSAKGTAQKDSVNFVLLTSQEDLDKNFSAEKNSGNEISKPDFIINYIIGMTCLPSQISKTITVDKAEVDGSEISIFITLQPGEKLAVAAKASEVFAVERRDGIGSIQFYVNGKKGQSFFMTGM